MSRNKFTVETSSGVVNNVASWNDRRKQRQRRPSGGELIGGGGVVVDGTRRRSGGGGGGREDGELSKRTMSDSVRVAARSHSPLPSRLGIGGSQRGRSSR